MPKTVILGTARTPIGKMGGGLSTLDATELGGIAIEAALERAGVEPEQVQHVDHGPGAPGRAGPDPLAPGADQGRHPEGGLLGDHQQGLRLGRARDRSCSTRRSAPATSRSASAAAWSRCRRRPTCCPRRASASAWATPRRSTRWSTTASRNPFSGTPDVRRGDRDRRRARDHAPRPRPLGAALARARDRRRPTRAACPRRSSPVTIKGRKGDTVVEVDEAPRRGTHARGARQAARPGRQGGLAHGRQLAGRQRRRRRARARLATSGPRANGKEALAEIVAHAQSANDFAYLATHARQRRARRRSRRPACSRATSTCGRSTRRSPPSTLNSIRDARHRRGQGQRQRRRGRARPPDRRLRRAHHRHARARAAPPRRRPRLRGDLLAAAARATRSSSRCTPARRRRHRQEAARTSAEDGGGVLRPRPHARWRARPASTGRAPRWTRA